MNAILSAVFVIRLILQLEFPSQDPASQNIQSTPPAGHWEGSITLPGTELAIKIDLEESQAAWTGSIDIPVQGLRGFGLADLEIKLPSVTFSLPNIPGDPKFHGILDSKGETIEGEFTQAEKSYPFRIKRTENTLAKGATPSKGIPGDGLAGNWQGSIQANLLELRLLFKLEKNEEEWTGTMESLDQNARDIPINEISMTDKSVELKVNSVRGTFQGELSEDGSEIVGEWAQGGKQFPLKVYRLDKAPDLSRPQDPKKPYPYHEEEIVFENSGAEIKLAGTFTYPKSRGPFPTAILVSGSGPQDRNETIMGHRPFLVLADHLTRHGIAVLRYDDRGVGDSEGRFSKALVRDFTSDALAAVDYLKSRVEVNPSQIGIIGHSEGGLVAPQAATRSSDVSFIVLLAGVGVPLEELLQRQAADIIRVLGVDEETAKKQSLIQGKIFAEVRDFQDLKTTKKKVIEIMKTSLADLTPEQLEAAGYSESQLEVQAGMVTSPWFRDLLEIDPQPTLEKVRCPVLAVNGKKDIQVAWQENLEGIENSVKRGGNSDVTIQSYPNLNHLFQTCRTGAMTEYSSIEETFNPEVLETLSEWILRKTTQRQ